MREVETSSEYRLEVTVNQENAVKLQEMHKRSQKQELSKTSTEAIVKNDLDEIRKYKQLADEGIITESEFEKKKKQLLGI